ncbi:DUF1330 domain-containing protein [Roseibium sp. LAB1]
MAAFVFFDVKEILDPELLGAYRSKVFETVEHFGGRYRVLGEMDRVLEGDWKPNIPVLIEFPDSQTARAWYESDLYAPLKNDRIAAARCDAVMLGGYEHSPGA